MIWETTQACDLACKHCRAEARPERHPAELGTDEAKRLLADVRRFGPIIFVFSGGDALKRPDIVELTRFGADLGLRMAITPATTSLCTEERLTELRDAGIARLAVSLDGPSAAVHDEFRRVAGSFEHGLRILRAARALGMSTQVNTVVARHNVHDFSAMAELLAGLGIVFWEVFFLVPVGRARAEDVAGAEAFEAVFHELFPSGFLPLSAGNVRTHDLVETYRSAPLFRSLRDRSLLKGKCGVCEYRAVCGGSRARAHAVSGDPLAAEPFCSYVPPRWLGEVRVGHHPK